jgi:glycosyltransferase involved in cell wall biosynthesis
MIQRPQVTVAIPTYNRARYVCLAIASVLRQTSTDFELLIVDNASTDATGALVKAIDDSRVRYQRNAENIGILANWNRCVELAKGKYLLILGDDDQLHSRFLEASLGAHRLHPNIGFSFTHCNKVDDEGKHMRLWGYDFPPSGLISGEDYLFWTLQHEACLTNSSTTLLNLEVLRRSGKFMVEYAKNVFDFNMWIRITAGHDVFFVDETLCDYRVHRDQVSQLHWRDQLTGKIGTYLELIHIAAILLAKRYTFPEDTYLEAKLDRLIRALSGYLRKTDASL